MIQMCIKPLDALFFRDSRPFTAGEETTAEFNFPSPLTFFGAIGNAILESTEGVEYRKFIKGSYDHPKLGKYDSDLKNTAMRLKGPFLYKENKIFFPPPANIWVTGKPEYNPHLALPYEKDWNWKWDINKEKLRPLKMPWVEHGKIKHLDKWISFDVLTKYLSGDIEIFPAKALDEFFTKEVKHGHVISRESLAVEKGFLYTATHIRFKDELEGKNYIETGFILCADGIEEKDLPDKTIYLGGERRRAVIKTFNNGRLIPEQPEVIEKIKSNKRFFIYLATPAIFSSGWCISRTSEFEGASLIGAAVNKPQYISGWKINKDNLRGEPRNMKRIVPPGSVYFFEAESWNNKKFEELYKKYHFGESLSDEYPSAGFGVGLLGSW